MPFFHNSTACFHENKGFTTTKAFDSMKILQHITE
jgi:hypothetical protein